MGPSFLLPDNVARDHGVGTELPIESLQGKQLQITLGITRTVQEASLQLSVMGSADGQTWKRVATFPPKSYCGSYSCRLDLRSQPDVRLLRAAWTMSRWSHNAEGAVFGFHVLLDEAHALAAGAA